MKDSEQRHEEIKSEYEGFLTLATQLAKKDVRAYPLQGKKERQRDRMERHLLGMLEMYHIRWGDPEQRSCIVNFLEREFFGIPAKGAAYHLSLNEWKVLRKKILSNEYQETASEGS